jgi:hypothetical protein
LFGVVCNGFGILVRRLQPILKLGGVVDQILVPIVDFNFTMVVAPRVKDPAWIHVDLVDEEIYCKYCKKCIREGVRICRLKEHLVGIRGQVAPCVAHRGDWID